MLRITNCKLSGVNSNSNATRASCKIVSRQCALLALIQSALGVESQRVRWNDETGTELFTHRH
jgi:hypothetical protein